MCKCLATKLDRSELCSKESNILLTESRTKQEVLTSNIATEGIVKQEMLLILQHHDKIGKHTVLLPS